MAAVGAVAAWALKAIAIAVAGGLGQSPLEGALFFLGFVLFLVAFVAGGLAATASRGTALRVVGALGGVAVGLLVLVLVDAAVGAVVPASAGWVQEEAGLWAASVLAAAIMLS